METGYYDSAVDPNDARFLLVGRTGSGKTALLKVIEHSNANVLRIDPAELSLQHIQNSNIVQFITGLGLRIDPFFEMLWRYTFAVELLRKRYKIEDHETAKSRLFGIAFKTKRHRAITHLKALSPEFWKSVDVRVAHASERLETDVKGVLGADFSGLKLSAEGARKLTKEQVVDVQQRVQTVIGAETLAALQDVVHFLAEEVFDDPQNPYYVIIDDLDKEFADDAVRVRLIKTLIDSVIRMRPIRHVKFLISVRADVLELVFEQTRDASFQQEKYEDCSLNIRWNYDDLFDMLNRRINELYRRVYTKDSVSFYDVFTDEVNKRPTREYILDRTLLRPRDAIRFVNDCFDSAQNSVIITPNLVKQAEAKYSANRLISLRDEWQVLYPHLDKAARLLRNKPAIFQVSQVPLEEIESLLLDLACSEGSSDRLAVMATQECARSTPDLAAFRRQWAYVMYKVGMVGVKAEAHLALMWSYRDQHHVNESTFHDGAKLNVHKMLWHELGTKTTAGIDA